MNVPAGESQYVISLKEVFWGGLLVAITMAMHGSAMLTIARVNEKLKHRIGTRFSSGLVTLIVISWLILLAHLLEVVVWAAFFTWKGAFPNHSLSYYFSLNEYTTVGSNYNLPLDWRLLEGMIATAGLLTFAWSTGILFSLAQEFLDQQMKSIRQKHTYQEGTQTSGPLTPAVEDKTK